MQDLQLIIPYPILYQFCILAVPIITCSDNVEWQRHAILLWAWLERSVAAWRPEAV